MQPSCNRLRVAVEEAVATGVVPGGVVLAGQAGQTVLAEAFGHRQVDPTPAPATLDTVYDLASLTKALSTSLLCMQAVEAGRLGLSDRLGERSAACRGEAAGEATVGQALCHAAGFVPHRPFYARLAETCVPDARRAAVVALAAREPLAHPPGTRAVYSDLGFILLGDVLETLEGEPLDRLFDVRIARPLGLSALSYAANGGAWLAGHAVAPTELCPVRGGLVKGQVHDLNAWAMGGVAGHAGLFGDAASVAALAHALCAAWRGASPVGTRALVDREVLRAFWTPSGVYGSNWRYGWDGPSAVGSLAGDRLARRAVGHLAFTGCSLWIDPERETFVLTLCNRVHPSVRDDPRFRTFRRALQDLVLESISYSP